MTIQKSFGVCITIIFFLGTAVPVQAFRPFLSEDAAVHAPGDFEIEFGLLDVSHQSGDLISGHPLQLDAGLVNKWNLILKADLQMVYKDSKIGWDDSYFNMASTDLFVKGVINEGSFHSKDKRMPSIGLLLGALFPTAREDKKVGFQGSLITSGKITRLIYHFNAGGLVDKIHNDPGVIWGVVLEYMISNEFLAVWEINGKAVENHLPDDSTLIGMILTIPSARLNLDMGARFGLTDPAPDWLFTLGLTYAFSLF